MDVVALTVFVVISTEVVVIFLILVGSVEIVAFSDSGEATISVVVTSSGEVSIVKWFQDQLKRWYL